MESTSLTYIRPRSYRPMTIAASIIIVVMVFVLYHPSLIWLLSIWQSDKEYSHGFLVPLVSLYIAWQRRDYLLSQSKEPRIMLGFFFLGASAILLLAGRGGGFILAEAISFLLILPGIILFLFGINHLRALIFPLLYLQFMIPWMNELLERLHQPFQLFSAIIGVRILEFLRYSVYQDGVHIFLPNITLEVARECSGVGFLISVIALGIPLVYLTQRSLARAFIVLLLGVGITILTNGVRVGLVGIMADKYGPGQTHGPMHIFQGWFIAQIGFLFLFLINWLFMESKKGPQKLLCERWQSKYETSTSKHNYPLRMPIILIALLACFTFYIDRYGTPSPVSLIQPIHTFPKQIGQWTGEDSSWFPGSTLFPGTHEELCRTYRSPDGSVAHLYIGYFASQQEGKSLINRYSRPLRDHSSTIPTKTLVESVPRFVNTSSPTIGNTRYSAVYWYRYPSGEFTDRYDVKLKGILNAILRRQNNGTVVVTAKSYSKTADSTGNLLEFTKDISPELRRILP